MAIEPDIPLVDIHRHIEGSIRISTIMDMIHKYQIAFPGDSFAEIQSQILISSQQPGVMAFINKMELAIKAFVNYDACWRIAYESVEDAVLEGINYVELRFSPVFIAQAHSLDLFGIVESVVDGIQSAQRDFDTHANIIGILSRTYGPTTAWRELDALLSKKDYLRAIDLAGDEQSFPGELFVIHFNRVVDEGLNVTIHAGESSGSQSIWQAIKQLHAQRLGHAVRAVDDPVLMDYLAEHDIPIESNLTSNVQTGTVTQYSDHPIKQFLANGIMVTINSDDPAISGIKLSFEYEKAAPMAGLCQDEIREVQMNGIKAAFLTEQEKLLLFHQTK
jgi:adenosine deaminase